MSNSNLKHPKLTQREKEVIYLISTELTNSEIAKKLFLSKYTIDSHKKNLFLKLQVSNSAGLIRRAYELKILPIEMPDKID